MKQTMKSPTATFYAVRQKGKNAPVGDNINWTIFWDVTSKSWGLLYYWSYSDNTFMLWIATGWKSWIGATKAMMPVKRYEDWLDRKYSGVGQFRYMTEELLPLEQIMEKRKTSRGRQNSLKHT